MSIKGTQRDPLGKDPLGSIENGTLYTANQPEEPVPLILMPEKG